MFSCRFIGSRAILSGPAGGVVSDILYACKYVSVSTVSTYKQYIVHNSRIG